MTKLLTVPQAAQALGVHRGTVYRLIAEGALPVVRVRSATRLSEAAIDEYARRNTQPAYRRLS